MRAGVETIRIMEEDKLLDNVTKVSAHLHTALHRELDVIKGVKEIRGLGLMIGIDLDRPCGVLMQRALDAGLLLSVTADSVVRLVPPLIITEAEADEVVALLVPLIQTFLAEAP
jgi:acetylornithine aminotransferase